jgi:cell division protein FtsB
MDWFLRLILLAALAWFVVSRLRGPKPEPVVDAHARDVRELEDEVYQLRTTVEDLRARIEDLEYRSQWNAEPPPDP